MINFRLLRLFLSGALLLLVAACGGGGGGSASPTPEQQSESISYDTAYASHADALKKYTISIEPGFQATDKEDAKVTLEALAGRDLSDSEVDAILDILNRNPVADDCVAKGKTLNNARNACRPLVAADCQADEVLDGGACRPLSVADCAANDQILSGDSCVACGGETPERYGNECGPSADMCLERNQILRGAVCGAPTADECDARNQRLNDAGDACRALVANDCAQENKVLSGGSCSSCSGQTPVRYGNVCGPTADMCVAQKKILRGAACGAPTGEECDARGQRLNTAGGVCRVLVANDCAAENKILSGSSCSSCAGQTPARYENECGPTADMCVARNQILRGAACGAPTDEECDARGQRLNTVEDACRALTNTDCQSQGQMLNDAGDACQALPIAKAPTDEECRANNNQRLNRAGTACRAPSNAECEYIGMRLNDERTACRAPKPSELRVGDCRGETPVYANKRCRAERETDCASYQTWNGSSCESTKSLTGELARSQKMLNGINAGYAHEHGYRGQGVTVGIIDVVGFSGKENGVDFLINHEDLAENYVPLINPTISSRNDGRDHAIKVVGIIAAARNSVGIVGIAPEAKWTFTKIESGDDDFHLFSLMIEKKIPIVNGSYNPFSIRNDEAFFIDVNTGIKLRRIPHGFTPYWDLVYEKKSVTFKEYYASFTDGIEDSDSIFVWAAGNDGWHRGNENIYLGIGEFPYNYDITTIRDERYGNLVDFQSIPNAIGILPRFAPDLRDNWLVAVTFDEDRAKRGLLASHSNGCGVAKMWCLAAPNAVLTPSVNKEVNKDTYSSPHGTSFSAPHVSGALALLKSAAPLLPMTVIHGIILTTATDYGDPGVDDVFGWGLVNVSAGITLIEGIKTAAPDGSAVGAGINLRDLQFTLPERFSYLRERLGESAAVALEITDGTYYNLPLSKIAGISSSGDDNKQQAEASLADLEMSFVEYAAQKHSALPFFARDGGGGGVLLQKREEGLHPFLAFDGGNNLAESAYQQVGFRWQKTQSRFGVVAEASHIRESEAFWGVDFGALGDMSAQTEQAKLLLSGELSEEYGWSGYAGYEHARARGLLSNSSAGNFIAGIEGAAASGWLAGLEKVNIFHRADRLRLSARQETRISGGGLLLKTPQASGGFTESFYGEIEQEVKLRSTLIPLREESSIIWGLGYASSIGSSEWAAAVEHDEEGKTSISAKWGYAF